jgi:hypothetical protein
VHWRVANARWKVSSVRGNGAISRIFVQKGGKNEKKGGIGPHFDVRGAISENFYVFIGLHFFPFLY